MHSGNLLQNFRSHKVQSMISLIFDEIAGALNVFQGFGYEVFLGTSTF
jgi:hypothetical protein